MEPLSCIYVALSMAIIQGTASPFESNSLHRLHAALIGIKRIQGLQQNPKMPITGDILKKLCQSLESGYFDMYTNILMEQLFC